MREQLEGHRVDCAELFCFDESLERCRRVSRCVALHCMEGTRSRGSCSKDDGKTLILCFECHREGNITATALNLMQKMGPLVDKTSSWF